ncbi:MAG: sugar phosphate isomerase/epimerase [Candidatus Omnitrophica bacterium]|nr:sugar phosphate isomerase/epimerase [Candidatus Omnitrophota bacterium]
MISRTARGAATLAFSSLAIPLAAAPTSRRFKIGACQWSLQRRDSSCMAIAKEIGLDGVQVTMGFSSDNLKLRRAEIQRSYLDAARENGVEVASLALQETTNFRQPRSAVWLLDSIEVCRAMGTKVVLLAMFGGSERKANWSDDKIAVDQLVDLLKEVGPRAEKAGVSLGIESYLSGKENMELLDRIGSSGVKVYYDVGNSTDKGYDIYKEIRELGPRICEFHFKDGNYMLGQGRIDFKKVREALDDIGFTGWIQLEAAVLHSLVPDYQADLAYLRSIFPS